MNEPARHRLIIWVIPLCSTRCCSELLYRFSYIQSKDRRNSSSRFCQEKEVEIGLKATVLRSSDSLLPPSVQMWNYWKLTYCTFKTVLPPACLMTLSLSHRLGHSYHWWFTLRNILKRQQNLKTHCHKADIWKMSTAIQGHILSE